MCGENIYDLPDIFYRQSGSGWIQTLNSRFLPVYSEPLEERLEKAAKLAVGVR